MPSTSSSDQPPSPTKCSDREIEHEPSGRDIGQVLNRVANFAGYLIERGSVIGDGDTIGSSAEERITVRHATSRRFANLPVLLVTAAGR